MSPVSETVRQLQGILSARAAKASRAVRGFRRDVRGIAAVEFGMIAPVALLILLGTVEVTRAISIEQRFSKATSMIADLVAREEKLTANDVNVIYQIVESVMSPYESAPLKVSIIPVMSSTTNASNTLVYPAVTNRPSYHGGAQPAKCQAYPLGTGLVGKNESVVVVEASYQFTPMFAGYLMGNVELKETAVAKPRKGLCVIFDTNCTTSCFP